MATYVELFLDQGSSFSTTVNIIDEVTNTPMNVANYVLSSQLRRSFYSANASGNLTCTIADANIGRINLTMTAANTANIKAGRYVFDVKATDPANITSRILEGLITVTPQVTR